MRDLGSVGGRAGRGANAVVHAEERIEAPVRYWVAFHYRRAEAYPGLHAHSRVRRPRRYLLNAFAQVDRV